MTRSTSIFLPVALSLFVAGRGPWVVSSLSIGSYSASSSKMISACRRATFYGSYKEGVAAAKTSIANLSLSDVPQDEPGTLSSSSSTKTEPGAPSLSRQQQLPMQIQNNRELEYLHRPNNNNDNDFYLKMKRSLQIPEPPEDVLTLAGDVASLFLYAFTEHYLNQIVLPSILSTSTSAAEAAKALDPSGATVALAPSLPVWLDAATAGPHISDKVLLWDLQSRVIPHFTPLLETAGGASVALASCWILAGLLPWNKAFRFCNTLDCSTNRAVYITGKTWLTSSFLLIGLVCLSHHCLVTPLIDVVDTIDTAIVYSSSSGISAAHNLDAVASTTRAASTVFLPSSQSSLMAPVEEWFSVLTRSDAEYVVNSLGVVLTWRFLISLLTGGWSK